MNPPAKSHGSHKKRGLGVANTTVFLFQLGDGHARKARQAVVDIGEDLTAEVQHRLTGKPRSEQQSQQLYIRERIDAVNDSLFAWPLVEIEVADERSRPNSFFRNLIKPVSGISDGVHAVDFKNKLTRRCRGAIIYLFSWRFPRPRRGHVRTISLQTMPSGSRSHSLRAESAKPEQPCWQ